MSQRPHVICHMQSSIDGRLHPSRYTASPDGSAQDWGKLYEQVHGTLGGDAWIVGRVTMAEMAKGEPHAPSDAPPAPRPASFATTDAKGYAIALDTHGKLHFKQADLDGDHVVVLLGGDVADSHLAELASDGISYIVSPETEIDLGAALASLRSELGIETLLLEGGGSINGSFLAAGLVDELSILIAPALDGDPTRDGIVAFEGGLKDEVRLSLTSCETLDHGIVHLRYTVSTPD